MKPRLLIFLFVALILSCFPQKEASAHTALVSTIPADGDRLSEPVNEISVAFTEQIQPFSKITVVDEAGNEIKPKQIAIDAKTMSATLVPPLNKGDYKVQWQAVADDGHTVEGQFSFTVDATTVDSPINSTTPQVSEGRSSFRKYVPAATVVFVIILILLGYLMLKPRRNRSEGK